MSADRDVVYRAAVKDDCSALAAFSRISFAATFGHLYAPADLTTYFAQTRTTAHQAAELDEPFTEIRLALQAGAIVGYCHVGRFHLPFETGGRAAFELRRLYVADHLKGAGIAAALMTWAIERARAHGAEDFYLGVYADNTRAQAFYRRFGFEIVGAYLFPVGQSMDDERIMRLVLTDDARGARTAGRLRPPSPF